MIGRRVFRTRWGATFTTDKARHSYIDLGLLPAERPEISPPTPDIHSARAIGSNGRLYMQLTDWPTYDAREGRFSYYIPGTDRQRFDRYTAVQTALHGQTGTVILDEDNAFYYSGIFTVDSFAHAEAAGVLTIRAELDPYKYDRYRTDQDWLWDPFSFETGVIREYGGLEVDGSRTVTVISSPAGGWPTVILSAAMTVDWDGTSYALAAGTHELTDIELPHAVEEIPVTFTGSGTASIRFRAGYL